VNGVVLTFEDLVRIHHPELDEPAVIEAAAFMRCGKITVPPYFSGKPTPFVSYMYGIPHPDDM
jgi:hypothetical protein